MDRGAQFRRPREGLCSFCRIAERSHKTDPRGVLVCSEASLAAIGNGRRKPVEPESWEALDNPGAATAILAALRSRLGRHSSVFALIQFREPERKRARNGGAR